MKVIADVTVSCAGAGTRSKDPCVGNKRSPRAALALWTLCVMLGLSAAQSALAVDQITYTYDALGRLHMVTYQNGTTVTYTYDPAGNRTQVTNTGSGAGSGPLLPQQRKKLAAIQAILSILLSN
ncbi:MAG: RHS repeat domain-containing protein [Steroidobacteraceae bacterium]